MYGLFLNIVLIELFVSIVNMCDTIRVSDVEVRSNIKYRCICLTIDVWQTDLHIKCD